jgi:hypothetical protein
LPEGGGKFFGFKRGKDVGQIPARRGGHGRLLEVRWGKYIKRGKKGGGESVTVPVFEWTAE